MTDFTSINEALKKSYAERALVEAAYFEALERGDDAEAARLDELLG